MRGDGWFAGMIIQNSGVSMGALDLVESAIAVRMLQMTLGRSRSRFDSHYFRSILRVYEKFPQDRERTDGWCQAFSKGGSNF